MLAPLILLCLLLVLLSGDCQVRLRELFRKHPGLVFAVAGGLASLFCVTAACYHALSWRLAWLVMGYLLLPTACMLWLPRRRSLVDLAVILMLWLPLEFAAGKNLVPRQAQNVLHATAYGIALVLALVLFLLVRRWQGMRYQLPNRVADLGNIVMGYLIAGATLIPLGLAVGFLQNPHLARIAPARAWERFAFIFFATAFPEEILFRALIQNWLVRRLKEPWLAVLIAGLIFGAAHLDNGPGPLPNWRYMAVATVAGWILGTVFLRSSSVLASAAVHAAINLTKYLFF
jgi:membrane protease YdiL (CAAX protease family)